MLRVRCGECRCVLRPWETVFSWTERGYTEYICADCFDWKLSELTREEKARILGSEIRRAEELGG